MIGIIYYLYFLITGFLYINLFFKEKDIYFRLWLGAVCGNLILMVGIVPLAFIFEFSYISHILLIFIAIIPYILIKLYKKDKAEINLYSEEKTLNIRTVYYLILPLTLLICVLLTNHTLTPYENGAVASGQSTYGDLQMHLGFITSIAEQGKFPPDYSFLSGYKLNYPFFSDMLSSSLYLLGTPLRWSYLLPSYCMALLLVLGFYILSFKITKRKSVATIATLFFFLNGGFGFWYFIDGAKADPSLFTRIFTEYYKTPTNYNEMNIRWSNTICDMIVPQHTTMAGWCMIIPCIYLLLDAINKKSKRNYILLGVIAGSMPMIHTHSFLALGIISAIMFFAYLFDTEDKKSYIINWTVYGGIALIMAMPQLCLWTFTQTVGNSSFLNFNLNWVNENDTYLWFYIKNWGMTFLLAIPAVFNADKDKKKLFFASFAIFIIAEFVQFQPNAYDNNKLFYITYMIVLIIVCDFLLKLYDKLKGIKLRGYFAILTVILFTLSGTLTICREYVSGGQYQTFSKDDINIAKYIKENVPKDAIVLTGTDHVNPVVTLAGRTVYVGSSLYVHFHGFGDEFDKRSNEVYEIFNSSAREIKEFCKDKNISYVFVGQHEKENINNLDSFNDLQCVYKSGNNMLYKIQ